MKFKNIRLMMSSTCVIYRQPQDKHPKKRKHWNWNHFVLTLNEN